MIATQLVRFRGAAPLLALLAMWQILGDPRSPYFPPPSTWLHALEHRWDQGTLLPGLLASFRHFGISLVLANALGFVLGFAMGRHANVDKSLSPLFEFLRVMPAAVVVPLFVLLLGFGEHTTITAIVFGAVWPIILATRSAIARLNPLLEDVAVTLHLSRRDTLTKVILPALVPAVLIAIRVAAPLTFILVLLVELLTGVPGIGSQLALAQQRFQSAEVYGLLVIVGIVAFATDSAVASLQGSNAVRNTSFGAR